LLQEKENWIPDKFCASNICSKPSPTLKRKIFRNDEAFRFLKETEHII